MSRPLRLEFEGAFYHVMSRGNERKPIFKDGEDRKKFLEILSDTQKTYRLIIHAYVLMTNHYHILAETPQANLSLAMRQINGVYTRYFNLRWKRFGHLFQSRFKSLLVEKDSYLLALSRYIHRNPLKARLVLRLEDYPWSSYPAYIGLAPAPSWLFLEDTLSYFESNRQIDTQRYQDFVLEREEENPWTKAAAGCFLGSGLFVDAMKSRAQAEGSLSPEHSRRKELELVADAEAVMAAVGRAYIMDTRDIAKAKGRRLEARGVAMYFLREKTTLSLPEIARRFNVTTSGAGHAISRLRKRVLTQENWRQRLAQMEGEILNKC